MLVDLANKTVLLTGATRGLGLQIAKRVWQSGANLILLARSSDRLQQVSDELQASAKPKQRVVTMTVDLSDQQAVAALLTPLSEERVDVLVNNAAIQGPIGPLWENDWQEWQATLQVNLLTPIALCRALLPGMIQRQQGRIINLSGGGATGPRPHFSAYAVAKAGLVRFSETIAEEVKSFHIAVNCVAPGVMNTDMLAQIRQAGVTKVGDKEYQQAAAKADDDDTVIKRAADLCLFLAASASDGITGKLISAVWDPWTTLADYVHELQNSDIYTLRRIVPADRGKSWGVEPPRRSP